MPAVPIDTVLHVAGRADTLVAYAIPVRDGLAWATDVLAILVLATLAALLGAATWLVVRTARAMDRLADTAERLAAGVKPMLDEATGIVADARATLGDVRRDVATLSAAVGSDLRDASAAVGARVARATASLDTLQEEFERSVRTAVRALRSLRRGAVLLGRLAGLRVRRRRPRRRNRDAADA
ncbi:MAG: hypothetical protein KJT01_13830 [Gemmatimonadetes bacterium]|nr:hypothetical protein [Gemmatimonadota bacterium]